MMSLTTWNTDLNIVGTLKENGVDVLVTGEGGGTPAGTTLQVQYNNAGTLGGANLWVTDANTIEKYNSTTAQAIKVYNTRTDGSNYERGVFDWSTTANVLTIGTQTAGTGTARKVQFIAASGSYVLTDVQGGTNMAFINASNGVWHWGRDGNTTVSMRILTNGRGVQFPYGTQANQSSLTLTNGLNSNIAPTVDSGNGFLAGFFRITGPTGAFSVGGVQFGIDGHITTLYNSTSQTMTIVNEDASSTAANRITTLTGANIVLRATSPSIATLIYDTTTSRWLVMSIHPSTPVA